MFGPKCQSCGMPLFKDENGGGTDKDGGKNKEYCSHCYKNGKFTNPDITFPEMTKKVKGKMTEMNIPGFLADILTRNMKNLKRWKND